MIMRTRNSLVQGLFLALILIPGLSGISSAAEFWLKAETFTKTMPDTAVVTMWGYGKCADATFTNCSSVRSPGPPLTVTDGTLTVHLKNNLAEATSIVINGQRATEAGAMTPVWTDGTGGPRTSLSQRVRSFTHEAAAGGGEATYTWGDGVNPLKSGTYLYQSGTHPAVQVQMGLYGAVTSDAAAGQAYGPATAYAAEAVLLFSEIDPVLHAHVAAGTYGTPPPAGITSTIDYQPRYFLINGEPYSAATTPIAAGIAGQNLLIRFLSAGLTYRVPILDGVNMSLVAEDGNSYVYPKEQYSLLLPPGKTVDAMVTYVPAGNFAVYDRRLGLTASAGGMLRYLSVQPDATLPTGSVVINGDAATTDTLAVTLTLSATDPVNTVTHMQFSWDGTTWSAWEPYATTANATIPTGTNGTKTVYVQFRDSAGNVSLPYSDSIEFLDVTAPTGSVVINDGAAATNNPAVTLTLSATDPGNAVTDMQFSWDGTTWSAWEPYATTANATIPAGPDGTKTVYVQFRDAAGNVSLPYSDSILLDQTAPTGSVLINGGAAETSILDVTLTLSATDVDSAVTDMRFSWDGTTWSAWEPYATTANATIPAGPTGTRTVYVQFRDAVGNVSLSYSDSILFADLTPPTGSVVINGGAASTVSRDVTLTLSATDNANAVTDMRFSWDDATWSAWEPYATSANATIPPGPSGTKTIYVQFRDAVGNVSLSYTDSILFSDVLPPTGSVVINGGAAATATLDVTLTLSATDAANPVTDMRFNWDGAAWSAWEPYATTANATIPVGPDGTKTVYVQFRDAAGNVSDVYSDSILLDRTPPTGSVVINGGAASAGTLDVTLTLSAASTASPVTDMRLSWDGTTWSAWQAFATTWNDTMPAGANGTRTVYVQFRDAGGNVSATYSDSILFSDLTRPIGSVVINGGAASTDNRAVTLTLTATDTGSPVTDMQFSWNGLTWTAWQAYATTWNTEIPGPNGTKIIRVRFRDAAGNVSVVYRGSILLADLTPPTGSVSINDGAATTNSLTVTLTLNATDTGSPVTAMRFSWNGRTWSDWQPYTTSRTATLSPGVGTKTIYVRFRDASRNVSPTYTDSIAYVP